MTLSEPDLPPLVAQWLPNQRWFAGKGRIAEITSRRVVELPGDGPPS